MHVISLSNISIKTNFKQIARVELKCVQYSEGDYILCMTSRYFFPFIPQRQVTVFCLTFQWYDVMSKLFGRERLVKRRAILLSPQCGDTTSCIIHFVSERRHSLISKKNVYNVRKVNILLYANFFDNSTISLVNVDVVFLQLFLIPPTKAEGGIARIYHIPQCHPPQYHPPQYHPPKGIQYNIKHTAFGWGCYGRLPQEEKISPETSLR